VKKEFNRPVKEGDCACVELPIYLATAIQVTFLKVLKHIVDELRKKEVVVVHF